MSEVIKPCLVFLPGALLTPAVFNAQSAHFKDRYQVVIIDYAKLCNDAEIPFSVDLAASIVGAMVVSLPAPVTLVGHSLGGIIAQVVAQEQPEAVDSLVLVETTFGAASGWFGQIAAPLVAGIISITSWRSIRRSIIAGHGKFAAQTKAYLGATLPERKGPQGYKEIISAALTWKGRAGLQDIGCPTLIVVGQFNRQTHGQATVMANEIPNARQAKISKAGHMVMMDNAVEFNAAIDEFLP